MINVRVCARWNALLRMFLTSKRSRRRRRRFPRCTNSVRARAGVCV